MDAIRIGLQLRALRIRRGLRQLDLARLAGASRSTISNLERGGVSQISLDTITRIAAVLGADVDVRIRWRGEGLDRLLDAGHAGLVNELARRFTRDGWQVVVEATFSIRGERGSIDILAIHPRRLALLIVEVKSVMPDFQAMVAAHDRKTWLGAQIASERGWNVASVSRLLVIEAGSTARDRVARLGAAMDAAYPVRGSSVRAWIRDPSEPISGLLFVRSAFTDGVPHRVAGRQRVRRPTNARSA